MHTKGLTKRLEHPHEDAQWVEIRKVSSGYLDVAREIFSRRTSRNIKDMGGLAGLGNIKRCPKCSGQLEGGHECHPLDVFAKEEREKGPGAVDASMLDRKTMLNAAITRWSAECEVNPDNVADLDEFTADWLFREIVSFVNEGMTVEAKKAQTKPSGAS